VQNSVTVGKNAIQILYLHGSSVTQQQGDKKLVLLLNNWKDGSCSNKEDNTNSLTINQRQNILTALDFKGEDQ
jgi:hypothetical protein